MRLREMIRKHRRGLVAAVLFCAGLLVFAIFWRLDVAAARQKGRAEVLNDGMTQTVVLAEGAELHQRVQTAKTLHSVGLMPVFDGVASGPLYLDVYGSDGALLAQVEGGADGTQSGAWAVFVLPVALQQPDGIYDIVVRGQPAGDGVEYAFAVSGKHPEGWDLSRDGEALDGSLLLMATTDRIGGFLTRFYWLFALLASVVAPGLYLLGGLHACDEKRWPIHRLFAAAALYIGLLYCMILPPYAAPDEQFHINQSFNISSRWMGAAAGKIEWGENVKRAGDHDPLVEDAKTTVFTYRQLAQNLFAATPDSTPAVYEGEQVGGVDLLYWPQAVAITLGRLLGLGFVPVLYMGRLANLVCAVLLVAAAVKQVPFAKGIFMVVALLPACMHQLASFSRDALTIGLYFFFTAYCLRLMKQDAPVTGKNMMVLGVAALLAAPAKLAYMPLLFLAMLLPAARLTVRGKALAPKWVWALRGVLCMVALAPFAVEIGGYVIRTFQVAAAAVATAPGLGAPPGGLLQALPADHPDNFVYTLPYILGHLKQTIVLVMNTVFYKSAYYWQTMVGGILGYMDLPISWGFVLAFTLLLAAALLPEKGQPRLAPAQSGVAGGLCLAVVVLVVCACLSWTPTYYETIYGIQGRYFLPLLPLVLAAGQSRIRLFEKTRPADGTLLAVGGTLNAFVLLNAFLVICAR